MNGHPVVTSVCTLLLALAVASPAAAQSKNSKYACTEGNPESLCTADNTCGSASSPCIVDVKKTTTGLAVMGETAQKKDNALFCIGKGTKVTFKSTNKNTGFLVDFGPSSPFDDPDAISGGSKKPATVTAIKPGCYKFSVGACVSGALNGMCNSGTAEAVVTAK